MRPGRLRRRRFLQAGASAAASAALISCSGQRSPWRFLSLDQARTLDAICEQIIPTDDTPGAGPAGVVHFMDRQLNAFHRPYRETYRIGLAGVNETSRLIHGALFAELTWAKQTAVLKLMESGKAKGEAWKQISSRQFFDLVVTHTMQGFYGSPRHGGNREAVSWRMLGVPDPPVRGRAQYDLTKRG